MRQVSFPLQYCTFCSTSERFSNEESILCEINIVVEQCILFYKSPYVWWWGMSRHLILSRLSKYLDSIYPNIWIQFHVIGA